LSLPSSKSGFIPELNGLRGVAILGVMFFHARVKPFLGGFIGVDIFFVLSGFLITRILINEFNRWGAIDLKNFYIRRILRLAPALIVMLLVYCLMSFIFLSKESAHDNYIDALISLTYLTNWAEALNIHPPDDLVHTWSLATEEQFYILWPILLFMFLRISKRRHFVAMIAIGMALASWLVRVYLTALEPYVERVYNGLDTRADGLMLGCAIGIVLSSGLLNEKTTQRLSQGLTWLAPIATSVLISLFVSARWSLPIMFYIGFTVVDLFTAILILDIVINPHSMTKKLLANKWLIWIGTISYGLYLWHYPIYRVLQSIGMNEMMVFSIGSPLALLIAAFSYRYLETPILKQKKHFTTAIPRPASG
jgi:peptidoglycan/LPS O-acetylase OafA/YrhL